MIYCLCGLGALGVAGGTVSLACWLEAFGSSRGVPHPGQFSGVGIPGITGMIFPHEGHFFGPEISAGLKHMAFSFQTQRVSSASLPQGSSSSREAGIERRIQKARFANTSDRLISPWLSRYVGFSKIGCGFLESRCFRKSSKK